MDKPSAYTKKMVWTAGTVLSQQHFQQWEKQQQAQSRFHYQLNHPDGWGLITLRVDSESLYQNEFVVWQCGVIFPNGFIAHHDASSSGPLRLTLKPDPTVRQKAIYLCLAENEHKSARHALGEETDRVNW